MSEAFYPKFGNQEIAIMLIALGQGTNSFEFHKIDGVMRRSVNRAGSGDVEVLDLYPPFTKFDSGAVYGVEKACLLYLDYEKDRQLFESFSGLRIEDIPLRDADTAFRRKNGPHKDQRETKPFWILTTPGQDENGENQKKRILYWGDYEDGGPKRLRPGQGGQLKLPPKEGDRKSSTVSFPDDTSLTIVWGSEPLEVPIVGTDWRSRYLQFVEQMERDYPSMSNQETVHRFIAGLCGEFNLGNQEAIEAAVNQFDTAQADGVVVTQAFTEAKSRYKDMTI